MRGFSNRANRASRASHLVVLSALLGPIASCGRNEGPLDPAASTSAAASASEDASARAARITRPGYDVRDYNEVIAAHDAALNARDFWLYSHILAPDFEFFPLEQDVVDFPWMDGYSWPLFEELNMIGNMFNPNYSGGESAIQSIQVATQIFNTKAFHRAGTNRARPATCRVSILTSDTDGWGDRHGTSSSSSPLLWAAAFKFARSLR